MGVGQISEKQGQLIRQKGIGRRATGAVGGSLALAGGFFARQVRRHPDHEPHAPVVQEFLSRFNRSQDAAVQRFPVALLHERPPGTRYSLLLGHRGSFIAGRDDQNQGRGARRSPDSPRVRKPGSPNRPTPKPDDPLAPFWRPCWERHSCSRSQSSAGLRAIIGLFLLKLTDSIGGAVLTLSATVLAIIALCAQTSVLLRTFFATE